MARDTHALVQYTHNLSRALSRPVHDDMGANKVKAMRGGQFRARVSKSWIVAKEHKGVV
jgi:hypothetical protein